ncbi:hypothetical protein E1H99_00355 [Enterococcus hirae]|nr:hypothetical protein E1H99_00355 [Enterococcus hirae]
MNKQKVKEFDMRFNILAMSLSLKKNDTHFKKKEFYQLLFSTYIKMIESDQDHFFIEEKRKERIIHSLERTKAFYDFEDKGQLQAVFETMINDDPSDFMLFPTAFLTKVDKKIGHMCGFTVYKRNEDFIVMKVDKQKSFDNKNVTYFKIPSKNIEELSRLFFETHYIKMLVPYAIFSCFRDLSSEVKTISAINMQQQSTSNCVVSEVEASLRTILFHCRTDIFSLSVIPKITPKWNLEHLESTLEMRRRFLLAIKGEDEAWNQFFDYIFDYYLYRKGKLVSNYSLSTSTLRMDKYRKVREIFSMDTYIPEMLKNGGQIPKENVLLKEEKIRGVDPTGILDENPIKEINSTDLEDTLEINTHKIKLFNERLPFIKIQRAKVTTQYIISRLEDQNKEIAAELQRREDIEMGRQDNKCSNQEFGQLVTKVVPHTKDASQEPINSSAKASVEKVVFSKLMMQSKTVQYKFQNFSQIEARNIKKQTIEYEK